MNLLTSYAMVLWQVPEFLRKQIISTYCLTYKKCMISACSLRFSDCDSCSTISWTLMFSYPVSVANACLSANGHILWPSFGEPVGLPTGVRWGVPWGVPCGVWQGEWVPFRCGCEAASVKWDSKFQSHILTVLYRSIIQSSISIFRRLNLIINFYFIGIFFVTAINKLSETVVLKDH